MVKERVGFRLICQGTIKMVKCKNTEKILVYVLLLYTVYFSKTKVQLKLLLFCPYFTAQDPSKKLHLKSLIKKMVEPTALR